jgi:outer membrane protein assembly factor BamE
MPVLVFSLTACSIYHMPIQQGNIITSALIKKIHKGMSQQELVAILGSPVLTTPFQSNRIIYIYTLQPTSGKNRYKKLEVTFVDSRISSFQVITKGPKAS